MGSAVPERSSSGWGIRRDLPLHAVVVEVVELGEGRWSDLGVDPAASCRRRRTTARRVATESVICVWPISAKGARRLACSNVSAGSSHKRITR